MFWQHLICWCAHRSEEDEDEDDDSPAPPPKRPLAKKNPVKPPAAKPAPTAKPAVKRKPVPKAAASAVSRLQSDSAADAESPVVAPQVNTFAEKSDDRHTTLTTCTKSAALYMAAQSDRDLFVCLWVTNDQSICSRHIEVNQDVITASIIVDACMGEKGADAP